MTTRQLCRRPLFTSLIALCSFVSLNASANTYICLGVDENEGFAELNVRPDRNLPVPAMAHVQGMELRLIESEDSQSLSLSMKKTSGEVIAVVANPGKILFSTGNISVNCVQK
jgi:hypothetical protein